MKEQVPFDASEIEDVKIIIKAKDKHWSIVPKESFSKETAKNMRILSADMLLQFHDIISTALEDINSEKLKKKKWNSQKKTKN